MVTLRAGNESLLAGCACPMKTNRAGQLRCWHGVLALCCACVPESVRCWYGALALWCACVP